LGNPSKAGRRKLRRDLLSRGCLERIAGPVVETVPDCVKRLIAEA